MALDEKYVSGFANYFAVEAIEGALPKNQNNPQQVPLGLYAEQLSGSAFTKNRKDNFFTWLYRILPSVNHNKFTSYELNSQFITPSFSTPQSPEQLRWQALPYPTMPTHFINGIKTLLGHGQVSMRSGAAVHLYACNSSMNEDYFYNADGELLIVPEEGSLQFKTEMGWLTVAPNEIIVIPRGVKFQVNLIDEKARGYICENFGEPFSLPDLGLMGPNCLAQARHFLSPTATFEDKQGNFNLICKYQGHLWQTDINHSPLNVVAWHGNYAPYKYDLSLFTVINSVSFDHPDPSIFTVLTSKSTVSGVANLDFVIFPERWLTMEHTMRLPYYHRNIMSEYMGLIKGQYDAKEGNNKSGFVPGGGSLHNCMSAHGPDANSYHKAITTELKPEYYQNTLAFMFESFYPWQVSEFGLTTEILEKNYIDCWDLPRQF